MPMPRNSKIKPTPARSARQFPDRCGAKSGPTVLPKIETALAGEATYDENLPLLMRRNGFDEQTWFSFSYSPVRDDEGVVRDFCSCTETTQQVLADERRAADAKRLRQLLLKMPGFVGLLSGSEHRYEYVNDAYIEISGPRGFIGRSVREVFPA